MAQVINTNVMSLNAQRNLSTSGGQLATALQRLSSGLRINSAKDDAAGLAIAERFTTQIRGLNQAARNANDGISLAQTGEGALAEITNNLQRIRELAVQAANSTNSASDRAALDQEVQQRLAEIQRVATQTSFNGQKILDGTFGTAAFQVGANVGETISIGLNTSMRTSDIGSYVAEKSDVSQTAGAAAGVAAPWAASTVRVANFTGVNDTAMTAGQLQINGIDIKGSADYAVSGESWRGDASAYAKAAAINASGVAGVTAVATTEVEFAAAGAGLFLTATANGAAGDEIHYSLTINNQTIFSGASVGTDGLAMDAVVSAINSKQAASGVVASVNDDGDLVLNAEDGRDIQISESFALSEEDIAAGTTSTITTAFSVQTVTDTAADENGLAITQNLTYRGSIQLQSSSDVTINQGQAYIGFSSGSLLADESLAAQNVLSADAANNTLLSVDAALTAVSSLRSTLGAIQNRFESTITNLTTAAENLTASRSRIQDADFAAETAMLTRAQILQQAGTAILAQANAVPQNVLSLLR